MITSKKGSITLILLALITISYFISLRQEPATAKTQSTTEEKQCLPQQRVAFAKTHKTGGSTVQNIILRYGFKHGLTFALPIDSWVFSSDESFNANMVAKYAWNPGGHFDMFAFHSRWNGSEVDRIIPKPSIRIALLRDPVDTFESGFVYMGLANSFKMDINQYAKTVISTTFPRRDASSWFSANQLLWDLGVNVSRTEDKESLRQIIHQIDEDFDLVMIAERFDESLILLKELLCWDYEDIQYIKLNERQDKFKSTLMSDETRLILQQWQWPDYQLYSYFSQKLVKQLAAFGQAELLQNLSELQRTNQELKQGCAIHDVDNELLKGSLLHQGHDMIKAIDANENCTQFIIRETEFVKLIRAAQEQQKGKLFH